MHLSADASIPRTIAMMMQPLVWVQYIPINEPLSQPWRYTCTSLYSSNDCFGLNLDLNFPSNDSHFTPLPFNSTYIGESKHQNTSQSRSKLHGLSRREDKSLGSTPPSRESERLPDRQHMTSHLTFRTLCHLCR